MGNNLADIYLSSAGARNAALQQWGASRRARRAQQDESLVDFGHSLLQMPSLIEKKREEDDIKAAEDAFSGALLQGGDLDSALGSLRMLKPRTRGGAKRLAELALQAEQVKTHRRAMALDAVKQEEQRRIQDVRKKIGAGKAGMFDAITGASPMPYSAQEATGIAFQQGVSPKDAGLDPIFRAEQAQMQEQGRNARAEDANAIKTAALKSIEDYRQRTTELKRLGHDETTAHNIAMEEIQTGNEAGRNARFTAADATRREGIRIRSEDVAKQITSREGIARAREKLQRELAAATEGNKTDAEKISAAKSLLSDASEQIKAIREEIAKAKRNDKNTDTSEQEAELANYEMVHDKAGAVLAKATQVRAPAPEQGGGKPEPEDTKAYAKANGLVWDAAAGGYRKK